MRKPHLFACSVFLVILSNFGENESYSAAAWAAGMVLGGIGLSIKPQE